MHFRPVLELSNPVLQSEEGRDIVAVYMLSECVLRICRPLVVAGAFGLSGMSVAPPARADASITESARKHFTAGVNYLQDPDGARYEDAYREFKAAYSASPSWKILGNLGLCAMKLQRDGEAIDAYREYLRQGAKEIESDERAQVQRDLETLQAGVVTVTIETVPAGATITDERSSVQGNRVVNVYGPSSGPLRLGIRAGRHRIVASLTGYAEQVWEFEARPGSNQSHVFSLSAEAANPAQASGAAPAAPANSAQLPSPSPDFVSRKTPTSVYIGLAATGVFAIGATVTGLMANSKHSQFEDANDGSDPAHAKDLRDSGKALNLATDVLLGGAAVALGTTAVLYFTRPSTSERSASLRPVFGSSGAGLLFNSRF
jgi:hypothetical protein